MLSCAILRRFTRNPQASCRKLPSHRQNLVKKLTCRQSRSLSFLPIVSSHDTAHKEPSRTDGFDKPRIARTSDERSVSRPTVTLPQKHTTSETSHDIDSADFHRESPDQENYFSASLVDGTVVYNVRRCPNLSHFEDSVLMIAKIWKQCSHEIIPEVAAQNIGIALETKSADGSAIFVGIHDMAENTSTIHSYKCCISTTNGNVSVQKSSPLHFSLRKIRKRITKALENHVGFVDQHGSLVMLSRPNPHALYPAFKNLERICAYVGHQTHAVSAVLDDSTVVSPVPGVVIEPEVFLSLAKMIWQWWQLDQGIRNEALSGTTHIRIIETELAEKCLRVEVWMKSGVAEQSLSRSVCHLSFSDATGSFTSSCIESRDDIETSGWGIDRILRDFALVCLNHHIAWINSEGRLMEGKYPEIKSLINRFKRKKPVPPGPQPLLSLKLSPTLPEPQAVVESGKPKLNNNHTHEEEVVVWTPIEKETAKHAMDNLIQKCDEPPAVKNDDAPVVSVTLHDGTLVVPNFKRCQVMSRGVGQSFSDILRVISQWRAQTLHDINREQRGIPLLIYVLSKPLRHHFDIELFLRRDGWFEQPMIRYSLHHTTETAECSFVESRPRETESSHGPGLVAWTRIMVYALSKGLQNHVGTVDKSGILRKSKKPTTHEAFYNLREPIRMSSTALELNHTGMKCSKARYTPPGPTDNRKPEKRAEERAEKNLEEAQASSMHDRIANTMKLAGALYDVSTMLNHEISNGSSQTDDDVSFVHAGLNMINEPNPVFKTMKNGEIDFDAVQGAMAELKSQLQDHKDKPHILAALCRRWKEELETRYPLMKRKSRENHDVNNLVSPRSELSAVERRAVKDRTSSEPDKMRSPVKTRYFDERSEFILTKPTSTSKEGGKLEGQQGKSRNNRDGKQPRNGSSGRSKESRNKDDYDDDGFSISAL